MQKTINLQLPYGGIRRVVLIVGGRLPETWEQVASEKRVRLTVQSQPKQLVSCRNVGIRTQSEIRNQPGNSHVHSLETLNVCAGSSNSHPW